MFIEKVQVLIPIFRKLPDVLLLRTKPKDVIITSYLTQPHVMQKILFRSHQNGVSSHLKLIRKHPFLRNDLCFNNSINFLSSLMKTFFLITTVTEKTSDWRTEKSSRLDLVFSWKMTLHDLGRKIDIFSKV